MSPVDSKPLAACAALAMLALATACERGLPGPVDIPPGEECSDCRMAISERNFASEIVRADGTAELFDDVGCMLRALERKPLGARDAAYVADFATGAWLGPQSATFVRAPEVHTPMGSGILAFATREAAAAAAERHHGTIHRFHELGAGAPGHR